MHTLHWIVVTILILIFSNKAPPEGTPLEVIDLTSDVITSRTETSNGAINTMSELMNEIEGFEK
ncbi:hypothetical protein LCGC14_2598350 [marine sediment metagenome]|uniref:Uncharacterized protein n=1 Tax=marine sediment metagenome TaxID=412755 RepID=A0A0F9A9Q0_9ZZZZ